MAYLISPSILRYKESLLISYVCWYILYSVHTFDAFVYNINLNKLCSSSGNKNQNICAYLF